MKDNLFVALAEFVSKRPPGELFLVEGARKQSAVSGMKQKSGTAAALIATTDSAH